MTEGTAHSRSRIALSVHHGRKGAGELARHLSEKLAVAGAEVAILGDAAEAVGRPDLRREEGFAAGCDLVIAIGGDGTTLRALRSARGVPVLAVNLGSLGFLSTVEVAEVEGAVERLVNGDYEVVDRMAVQVHRLSVAGGSSPSGTTAEVGLPPVGANEVSVEKSSPHRLVQIRVAIDGSELATYRADGVLVATPTGSTAYAFSVHGPLVDPRLEALLVLPVAAHGLFDRCVVVPPSSQIELQVEGDRDACLAVDGKQWVQLPPGSSLTVSRAVEPIRFAYLSPPKPFVELLAQKFGVPR
jgi:NAD+ kinase